MEKGQEGGQEKMQEIQSLAQMLGPLIQQFQEVPNPPDKLKIVLQILEVLARLKELFAEVGQPDAYNKQFGQLEAQMQQIAGQLQGAAEG